MRIFHLKLPESLVTGCRQLLAALFTIFLQETLQLLSIMTNDNRFEEAYNTNTDGQKGGPRNMCDVLDKVENRGIAKGIAKGKAEGKIEGEDTLALLMKKLFDQNRIEDAKRASENKEYRAQLMKELGIN